MEALEMLIVASLVVSSLGYSVWRLTSARFHLRIIDSVGGLLGGSTGGWLDRVRQKTLTKLSGSGCGSCASNTKIAVHRPGSSGPRGT